MKNKTVKKIVIIGAILAILAGIAFSPIGTFIYDKTCDLLKIEPTVEVEQHKSYFNIFAVSVNSSKNDKWIILYRTKRKNGTWNDYKEVRGSSPIIGNRQHLAVVTIGELKHGTTIQFAMVKNALTDKEITAISEEIVIE